MVPLSRRAGGLQAYKLVMPPSRTRQTPDLQTHDGYEWLYVLDGLLRLVLGERANARSRPPEEAFGRVVSAGAEGCRTGE